MCLVRVHQTPITPVQRCCHTNNNVRSRDMGYKKQTKKCSALHAECFESSSRQKEKKNKKETVGKDIRDDEISEETQEENNTHYECDQDSSVSFDDDDEECTTSHEDNLEDWIECLTRSTQEADEKMLTYTRN